MCDAEILMRLLQCENDPEVEMLSTEYCVEKMKETSFTFLERYNSKRSLSLLLLYFKVSLRKYVYAHFESEIESE